MDAGEPIDPDAAARHWKRRGRIWSTIAILPFLAFPAIHWLRFGADATGLTTYDLPYYAANAQAVLERGRWGAYPNPFDPGDNAPVIYFHWLIDVLALLIGPFGLSPGVALLLLQIVGAWLAARVMFDLATSLAWHEVDRVGRTLQSPDRIERLDRLQRLVTPMFLATMWGGGLLISTQLAENVLHGERWNTSLLALDPGQGLWCLNFGRNLILPTEAIYHAIGMALWLAIMQERWRLAAAFLWLIATTHPFSGAQMLAIVGSWCAILVLQGAAPPRRFLIHVGTCAAAFAGYYFWFLPRFPQHRALEQEWTLQWVLPSATAALAFVPAFACALLALTRDPAWRRRCGFLMTAAGVSFLLANHHWFVTPRQPIHFARGYIWTPLFLMGFPVLMRSAARLLDRGTPWALATLGLIGLLVVSDNAGFLAYHATTAAPTGFALAPSERAAFEAIDELPEPGVLLTDSGRLGYLAAAYTEARPWIGHKYNTPEFESRREQLRRLLADEDKGAGLEQVDTVLTAARGLKGRLLIKGWDEVSKFGDLGVWQRGALATPRRE